MKKLALLALLFSAVAAYAQNVSTPIGPNNGPLLKGLGTAPTANTCVGFSLAAGGSDAAGKISLTSATTCSVNFGTTFTNAPACVITPGSAASTTLVTTTTGGFAVTFGTANTAFSYVCIGQ